MVKKFLSLLLLTIAFNTARPSYILIPMDGSQVDHLKAYGLAYWMLTQEVEMYWLLNYRGGAFMAKHTADVETETIIWGVSYEVIADAQSTAIITEVSDPNVNMDAVKLETAPKIAVYSPPGMQPWDDAVTLVLTYADIPYEIIYDEEVIMGKLPTYDWLHLHHEDFTGQYGKFWYSYRDADWYKEQVRSSEALANKLGYTKVSQLKLAVSQKIKEFTAGGGYLFAMCSATDSYDIALSAEGVDICESMFDGDVMDADAQSRLDYTKTFAFTDFKISTNPAEYEYSDIDATNTRRVLPDADFFTLFEFSAKTDQIPTILTQNHEMLIKGFMGQTTAFTSKFLKTNVKVLGENKAAGEARYIHGEIGKGFFTFYGGHDPEDYQHMVGDPPTDLRLYPNSPGYRLILNNILFPAAKPKHQKT